MANLWQNVIKWFTFYSNNNVDKSNTDKLNLRNITITGNWQSNKSSEENHALLKFNLTANFN